MQLSRCPLSLCPAAVRPLPVLVRASPARLTHWRRSLARFVLKVAAVLKVPPEALRLATEPGSTRFLDHVSPHSTVASYALK